MGSDEVLQMGGRAKVFTYSIFLSLKDMNFPQWSLTFPDGGYNPIWPTSGTIPGMGLTENMRVALNGQAEETHPAMRQKVSNFKSKYEHEKQTYKLKSLNNVGNRPYCRN